MSITQAILRHKDLSPPPSVRKRLILLTLPLLLPATVQAFDSGSTGADGPFNPTVNTRLQLPENGVFNFTTVNIPAGVTVTFGKNTTNTPVVMLASGDVNISGALSVGGSNAANVGAAGDGNIGDDALQGRGGAGGYDGGMGGPAEGNYLGGNGLGPGGGERGYFKSNTRSHGGGGSFGTMGTADNNKFSASAGNIYGSGLLLPLVGGSGGGGGMGGNAFAGSSGGGGGGALLIASNDNITVNGSIWANGGQAGHSGGGNCGAVGGGGSGGGIRLVANTIAGNGTISASGGSRQFSISCSFSGYNIQQNNSYMQSGGTGRIRFEADTLSRTAATNPPYTFGPPGDLFIAGLPTLRISRVAGEAAPTSPTGVADISLPADVANPVTVEFETTGIPLGNIVKLTLTPQRGSAATALSDALDGDTTLATASTRINLPQGPSTLLASITYTLVAGVDDARLEYYERIAGEPVRGLRIETGMEGPPRYVLITAGGREIPLHRAQLAAG